MWVFLGLSLIFFFFATGGCAYAFGPGVHLELALKFLEKTAAFEGLLGLCFLYGNLVPDYFLSSGTLKKLFHNEETHLKLLTRAQSPGERAFVAGFGAHLKADKVAHERLVPALKRRLELPERLIHYYLEWTLERNRASKWYLLRGLLLWPAHQELDQFLIKALALDRYLFLTRKWVSLTSYRVFKIRRRRAPTNLALLFERCFQSAETRCLAEMATLIETPSGENRCG